MDWNASAVSNHQLTDNHRYMGTAAKKLGGEIALNSLSKKAPGTIKKVVTELIDVAGKDRNAIKNLTWAVQQNAYKNLPDLLIGKTIPQIFNSIAGCCFGYGTTGVING